MTKEEAIKIIEYTFLNADGHLKPLDFDYGGGKGIVEALRMAIEVLSKLSIPSNLGEAAEKYANETTKMILNVFENVGRYEGFKAGAEWMAGQGETLEVEVKKDAGGYPYIPSIELYDYDKDEPLSKPGDKVVVQIRRK